VFGIGEELPAYKVGIMAFEIFISYSHQDQAFRQELEKHLSNLKRQHVITSWYDGNISPGTEWGPQIREHLNTAQIILLLVSADFMASDFCYSIEMTRAIARHDANQARVIPIILRPTDWKGAPFAKLKMLPTDGKPITRWPTHDDAFEDIVQGIRAAIDDLVQRAKPSIAPLFPGDEVLAASVQTPDFPGNCSQGDQQNGKSHELIFARVTLDKNNRYWREGNEATNEETNQYIRPGRTNALIPDPFRRKYTYHFHTDIPLADSQRLSTQPSHLVGYSHEMADPSFDITLLDTTTHPIILTAVGIEIVSVSHIFALPGGAPRAFKIDVTASYTVDIPPIWEQEQLIEKIQQIGYDLSYIPPIYLNKKISANHFDPIYVEPQAPFRYTLLLNDYWGRVPNGAIVRLWVQTHHELEQSLEIYLSVGNVWHEKEDVQKIPQCSVP
jgi:hypothetical protein